MFQRLAPRFAMSALIALPGLAQTPAQAPAQQPASPTYGTSATYQAPAAAQPAPNGRPVVRLVTNYGPIVVELDPQAAPKTVENFLRYVREGRYKGTIFHRVIPFFMIQGGGLDPDMSERPTHEPIVNEAPDAAKAGLKNTRGTISMARLDSPNSGTCQFFINVVDNPALDNHDLSPQNYGYCPFGRVTEGMDIADAISKVRTVWMKGQPNVPDYPVRIKDVVIVSEGAAAPAK